MHLHTEVPSVVLTALSCDLRQKSDWLKIMWLERAHITQQLPHLRCGGGKLSMEGFVWMNCRWIYQTNTDEPIESSIWLWHGITSPAAFRQCCHGNQTHSHAPTAMTAFQHLQLSISYFFIQFGSLWLKFHPFQVSNPGRLGHWPLSKTHGIYNRSGTKPYHHAAFVTCLQ